MRIAIAALALAQTVLAQNLLIERAGMDVAARLIKVVATDASALELLTRAAAVLETPLRIDPTLLDDLSRRTVTVQRERVVLDELALLVGTKLGIRVCFENGGLALSPGAKTRDSALAAALEHVDHALIGHAEPQLMAALRYQRACLLLESGAAGDAATSFASLVRDFPGHPAAPEARVLALAAAVRAGRHAEALGMLATIEESREGIPPIPGAELLPARIHAAAGNLAEALVRARKVATTGRFERDRALSGLMAAEIQQRLGDGAGMLAAVRGLPADFAHSCRDLEPLAALASGLALRILHDERAAVVHLRVAFRTIQPAQKPTVACAIAECLATLDQPIPAWLALHQAESLEKDASEVRRIQVRRAEIEESFGAIGRATETCTGILHAASGPFPEADRVLATLARCLIASDRVDDARVSLEALADREAYRGWALFRLALLERRSRDPERALRALTRLGDSDLKPPGPAPDQVRTLRGELLLDLGDPLQAADVFRGTNQEVVR